MRTALVVSLAYKPGAETGSSYTIAARTGSDPPALTDR
jgi:hypothetical protein